MSHTIIKRAIVYARVSSDQQRDSGSSLDTQAAACLALAKREGYSVLAVVQESFSGAELWARPKLGQIREQIRSREIDALICYTVDRLTRNIAHLMVLLDECERFGVVPLFVMESLDQSPEGKLLMSVRGYVGEVERLKIIERTSRGRRARIDRGQLPGSSTSLYGYDRNAETSARTINAAEAAIIRRIWQLSFDGSGSIARQLNAEAIPAPSTGKITYKNGRTPQWSQQAVRRILREPAYAGLSVAFRWRQVKANGTRRMMEQPRSEWVILPDGLTPPLFSLEEFDRMQALVSTRRCGDAKRNQTRFYLLRGMIFCPCGRRRSPDQKSYRCTSRIDAGQHCGSVSTSRRWIEREVWQWFAGFLRDPVKLRELLAHKPAATASEPARMDELAARIGKLTGQLKRAASAAVRAESDDLAKMYEMEIRKIEAERRGLQMEWERLRRASSAGLAAVDDLLRMAERLAENAETLPPDHQRAILQAFGVRVTADGRAWEGKITA